MALGRTTLLIEGIRQKSSGQSRTLVLPETAPSHSWFLGVLHNLVPWKISFTTSKPAIYHFADLVALLLLGSVRGQMLVSLELWPGASLPLLLALE